MIFFRETEHLKKKLLTLSALVEEDVRDALRAIQTRDRDLANEVISADNEIDAMEIEVEEDCLKILALHQPVARDLRFIVAVLKMTSDLERIGDLSLNIAERALYLAEHPGVAIPGNISMLAEKAVVMLKKSLDALVHLDGELATEVCRLDDEVDALHSDMYAFVRDAILAMPSDIDGLLALLSVSRYLERIADHATNIAEDVLYIVDGEIMRHKM
jgi:phosphate transport system protein